MPTKKKRVGFIPREDVMKIIEKLGIENNLSNSKIISILVEEALSIRGIFNKKTGKVSKSYIEIKEYSKDKSSHSVGSNNEQFSINTNLGNNKNFDKTNLFTQKKDETFDSRTYKKFLSFLKFQEMMNEFET